MVPVLPDRGALTHYAPRETNSPFGAMVDLLAAAVDHLRVVGDGWRPSSSRSRGFNRNLGWLFLFKQGNVPLAGGGTIFTAWASPVMVLPHRRHRYHAKCSGRLR